MIDTTELWEKDWRVDDNLDKSMQNIGLRRDDRLGLVTSNFNSGRI